MKLRILIAAIATAASLAAAFMLATSAKAADLYTGPAYFNTASDGWSGYYAGVNGGYASEGRQEYRFQDISGFNANVAPGGMFGGVTFGANWQTQGVVLGVETDLQTSGFSGENTITSHCCGRGTVTTNMDWFGTLRIRGGIPIGEILPYATGGLAYGSISTRSTICGINFASDTARAGWTVGAGVEWKISPVWSLKAEFDYLDFGAETMSAGPVPLNSTAAGTGINAFRIGINYKLGAVPRL